MNAETGCGRKSIPSIGPGKADCTSWCTAAARSNLDHTILRYAGSATRAGVFIHSPDFRKIRGDSNNLPSHMRHEAAAPTCARRGVALSNDQPDGGGSGLQRSLVQLDPNDLPQALQVHILGQQ